MRALVQRVTRASVTVQDSVVAAIGPGLLVLLGVARDDDSRRADRLAEKVLALRVFDDDQGRMNEPLGAREVLCISQFTLYGDARRGTRPSYTAAAAASARGWRSSSSTTVPSRCCSRSEHPPCPEKWAGDVWTPPGMAR